MYIYQERNGKLTPLMAPAKDVKINDLMMFHDGSLSKVSRVMDFDLQRKVSINTAGGSFLANGVMTSGMCDNYDSDILYTPANEVLNAYVKSHGEFNNCVLKASKSSVSAAMVEGGCLHLLS